MDEPGNGVPPSSGKGTSGTGGGAEGVGAEQGQGAGPEAERDDRDTFDRLAGAVGPRLDDLRSLVEEAGSRWRGDALRIGEGTRHRLRDFFHELGLVTRDDLDELELRVAQVEHRLRLLEEREDSAA